MKICPSCKLNKERCCYDASSKNKDGLQSWCKDCLRAKQRERYYRNRQKEIEKSKTWNKNNKEKVAANMRKCRELRPDHFKEYNKEWKKNNRDKVKVWDTNKCVRRRSKTAKKLKAEDWTLLKERQKHRCWYCGGKKPLTVDHVIPLINGGEHEISNIVGACHSCNSRKSKLSVEEFAMRNGRLFY